MVEAVLYSGAVDIDELTEDQVKLYRPKGGALELFTSEEPTILFDGPAGTGKSRAAAEKIHYLCQEHPGIRVLVCRKTLTSLRESWQVTFETKVLAEDGELGQYVLDGPNRSNRARYDYPNGSCIVLGGLDKIEKLFSTEYDVAYCNEVNEFSQGDFWSLRRALRNAKLHYQQLIGDCNPDAWDHWANQDALSGKMHRIVSRHADNPFLTDTPEGQAYLKNLAGLPGLLRERLYEGRWVNAEGVIFDTFDRMRHVVEGRVVHDKPRGMYVVVAEDGSFCRELKGFFASMDFGYRNPGCLQVWGVDGDDRCYLVAEVYRSTATTETWANWIGELYREYPFSRVIADHAEPGKIAQLNDILVRDFDTGRIVGPCDKDPKAHRDMMQLAFAEDRLILLEGVQRYESKQDPALYDPVSGQKLGPIGLQQEIPQYTWRPKKDGQPYKEEPDPLRSDHACDAAMYGLAWHWKKDIDKRPSLPKYAPGSYGAMTNIEEFFENCSA